MVKDRLEEFKAAQEEFKKEQEKKKKRIKIEKETMETEVAGFQGKVHHIEENLKTLREEVKEVKKMQSNLYCSPFVKDTDLQKMEHLSDQILTDSIRIRKEIELISAEGSPKSQQKSSLITSSTHQRVHATQIERLSNELRTTMNDFRASQADYVDKTKARFRRQMEIVSNGNDTTGETVDMNSVFTGGILMETQKVKGELQDLYEREEELHELEGQIHEVNKLFKEVHCLVSEQGEQVDNIESRVNEAVDMVESGGEDLKKAKENQTKARKKRIICIILLIVLFCVIGGIVAAIVASNS